MTEHYFLRDDFEALNREIDSIARRIKELGKEMGASCEEGAETFHDNFAYEDGERRQRMWSHRWRDLVLIRNAARVVDPAADTRRVALGRHVATADCETGEERTIRIGSFMTFNGDDAISYHAPLARMLIGAEEGDVRKGRIGDRSVSLEVIDIW